MSDKTTVLTELSLVNKASEVESTLVTAVEVVERVVAEVVVGGRGAAFHTPDARDLVPGQDGFMAPILELVDAHQDGLLVELVLDAHVHELVSVEGEEIRSLDVLGLKNFRVGRQVQRRHPVNHVAG